MATPALTVTGPVLYEMYPEEVVERIVRAMSGAVRDGLLLIGPDGTVVWHNPVALRLLRRTSDGLLGRSMIEPNPHRIRLDGSTYPTELMPAAIALSEGVPSGGPPLGSRTGDGTLRWYSYEATPVDVEGVRHAIVVFSDITDEIESRETMAATKLELESSLIPDTLPSTALVRFAGTARSGTGVDAIGGDFYGASADDATASFFIGDVCGHGIRSVGLSAMARNTLRAVSSVLDDPLDVMSHLHDLVRADRPQNFLTALTGCVTTKYGINTLTFVSAGHPVPILIRDGSALAVGRPSPLVGMHDKVERTATSIELRAGDRVVMYTDGVTDSIRPRITDQELVERVPTDASIESVVDVLGRMVDVARSESDGQGAAVFGFQMP